MSCCRAGIVLTACLAGSIKIPRKQSAVSWSSAQCLGVSTRSQYHVTWISAPLSTSAVRFADHCSLVVMLARTSVAIVGHVREQRSRKKIMANAVSPVAVTTPTAGMPVLLPVMVMNHARFAMRGATSSAATRDAPKSAASHARHALKRSARLVAPTQSATCRVPLRAIGCHARSDARDFCDAVINVRLSAAQTARARCTVRSAHQTRSKTFELTLSC
jgi:hypothetical protein